MLKFAINMIILRAIMQAKTLFFLSIVSSAVIGCCRCSESAGNSGNTEDSELLTSSEATVVQTLCGKVAGYVDHGILRSTHCMEIPFVFNNTCEVKYNHDKELIGFIRQFRTRGF